MALAALVGLAGCLADEDLSAAGAALCETEACVGGDRLLVPRAPGEALHPRLVSGLLSQASSRPAEEIARALLEDGSGAAYRLVDVRPAGDGTLVRLQQTHAGLDVAGGSVAIRLDALGRARWLSSGAAHVDPALDPEPELSAPAALDIALGYAADPALAPERHTRLVVLADPGLAGPRLAWHVVHEDAVARRTYRVYVDARDGQVLSRESLTRRAPTHRARVWDVSPAESDLEEVVFEALPEGAEHLLDDDVEVLNCIDERRCHEVQTTVGLRRVHHCEMRATAAPGRDGSFLSVQPPVDHAALEDSFAEVQAYHHVRSGLAAFRRWSGDPGFALAHRLTTIVNMRVPDLSTAVSLCAPGDGAAPAGSALGIEENAYFWPAGGIGPTEIGDRIVMHQTALSDWAYDGETVYHELTHAVMHTTTPLAWRRHDELGVDYSAGGLHEGFSDYFAAAITGNAQLSAYAGTTESGPEPVNDLTKLVRCGDVLTGEEHEESEPWVGALWAIRRSLRSAEKRAMFNAALFTVVSSLGQFDAFERAHALVLAELQVAAEELVAQETLDEAGIRALEAALASAPAHFADRGLPDCNGRVLSVEPNDVKGSLQVLGPNTWGLEQYRGRAIPAGMQLRLTLHEATPAIRLFVTMSDPYDSTLKPSHVPSEPDLRVLLREGDRPIRWRWAGPEGVHDADREAPVTLAEDEDLSMEATLEGPFEAGVHHLQITNAGADWVLYELGFQTADADGFFDDAAADRAGHLGGAGEPAVARGCQVVEGHGPPALPWALQLALLALLARRAWSSGVCARRN